MGDNNSHTNEDTIVNSYIRFIIIITMYNALLLLYIVKDV